MGRRHNLGLPKGWQPRGKRPRWNPSENIRKLGWRGMDLKDDAGVYLDGPKSQALAFEILAAVEAWRLGQPVPDRFAHISPAGAAAPAADSRSIGALLDKWMGDKKGNGAHATFLKRSPNTQRSYRAQIKRFVDALAGYGEAPPRKGDVAAHALYLERVAAIRAAPVFVLEPRETGRGINQPIYDAYERLKAGAGVTMARNAIVSFGTWLHFLHKHETRTISRAWAGEVERDTPEGRIRAASIEEIDKLRAVAAMLGMHSMGHAITMGVILSWSAVDRRQMTWDQVTTHRLGENGETVVVRVETKRTATKHQGRQKTGRVGATTLPQIGVELLDVIRARQARMFGPNVKPTHVFVNEATGLPYTEAQFGAAFRRVRDHAAKTMPSLATLQDRDLRDTAITQAAAAGCSFDEIATRSMQARASVPGLMDKHYGEFSPEVADAAAKRLDEHYARIGMRA